jgi:hypothetical protein
MFAQDAKRNLHPAGHVVFWYELFYFGCRYEDISATAANENFIPGVDVGFDNSLLTDS